MSTVPAPAQAPAPNPLVGLTGDPLAELVTQIATRTEQHPRVQQTIPLRGRENEIENIAGPARNLLRLLRMERRSTSQKNNLRQITPKGSGRTIAGPLRRRKTRRELGNMEAIGGNPPTTLRRRGCQGNSPKQDHGHYAERKNDNLICQRIQNHSGGDRVRRKNFDQTPTGGMSKKLQDTWEAGETDNLNTALAITRWAIAKENKHSMMDHIRKGRPTGKFDTTP